MQRNWLLMSGKRRDKYIVDPAYLYLFLVAAGWYCIIMAAPQQRICIPESRPGARVYSCSESTCIMSAYVHHQWLDCQQVSISAKPGLEGHQKTLHLRMAVYASSFFFFFFFFLKKKKKKKKKGRMW